MLTVLTNEKRHSGPYNDHSKLICLQHIHLRPYCNKKCDHPGHFARMCMCACLLLCNPATDDLCSLDMRARRHTGHCIPSSFYCYLFIFEFQVVNHWSWCTRLLLLSAKPTFLMLHNVPLSNSATSATVWSAELT